jgi:hypothetical protein
VKKTMETTFENIPKTYPMIAQIMDKKTLTKFKSGDGYGFLYLLFEILKTVFLYSAILYVNDFYQGPPGLTIIIITIMAIQLIKEMVVYAEKSAKLNEHVQVMLILNDKQTDFEEESFERDGTITFGDDLNYV